MYKDVWKKYGTKILIVLCSVLLLGGVAVAVPRLQALTVNSLPHDQLVDLTQVGIKDEGGNVIVTPSHTSGMAIKVEETFTYNQTEQYPRNLMMTDNQGNEYPLSETNDYMVASKGSYDRTSAGKQVITITGKTGSNYLKPNTSLDVEYTIKKAQLPSGTDVKVINTTDQKYADYSSIADLLVKAQGETIGSGRLEIRLGGPGGTLLSQEAYSVKDASGADFKANTIGGRETLYIDYTNYYVGSQTFDNTSWGNKTVTVLKDLGSLTSVEIDGTPLSSYQVNEFNKPGTGTISDNGTPVSANFSSDKVTDENGDAWEVRFDPVDSNYGGYWIRHLSFKRGAIQIITEDPDFSIAHDYDEDKHTYEFKPSSVKIIGQTESFKSNEFEPLWGQGVIVTGQSDTADPIPGATAGIVRLPIELKKTGYEGVIANLYYPVKRNIAKAHFGNKEKDGVTYEYTNSQDTHPRTALVYYTDAPNFSEGSLENYCLREGTEKDDSSTYDYRIKYKLSKWDMEGDNQDAGTYIEGNITDAGSVYMTIIGNLGETDPGQTNKGGYYGTVSGEEVGNNDLSYKITQKDVEKSYKIRLTQTVFPPTFSQPNVLPKAKLVMGMDASAGEQFISKLQADGERITMILYESDKTTPITDWSTKSEGTYWAAFTFSGNYKGTIGAEFKIDKYDAQYIEIDLGACAEDGTAAEHLYSGNEHRPSVIAVRYTKDGDSPIPVDEYRNGIKYENNINAGTATVTVTLSSGISKSKTFVIKPQDLSKGKLELIKDDGFKGSAGSRTHDYTGPEKLPELTKLKFTAANGKVMELLVKSVNGKPADIAENYFLWDDTLKKQINAGDVQVNVPYSFAVAAGPSGNFVNSASDPNIQTVLTETFQFNPRPISEPEIDYEIKPIPYNPNDTADDYKTYIEEELIVTDDLFHTTLQFADGDYTISDIDISHIGEDSTVRFKINGGKCYNKDREGKLYVGNDITLSKIVEKGTEVNVNHTEVGLGTARLEGPYAKQGDSYNVPFSSTATRPSQPKNEVYLRFYTDRTNYEVLNTSNYFTVDIDKGDASPEDPDDSSGKQLGKLTITGKNGYYGTITVTFAVEKICIDGTKGDPKYKIVFLKDDGTPMLTDPQYMYSGDEFVPDFKVLPSDGDAAADVGLIKDIDYKIIRCVGTDKANENYTENYQKAYVEIEGIYGYYGKITAYFTILKRPIFTHITDADDNDTEKDVIDSTAFELRGWEPQREYLYTPYTRVNGTETPGVLPQVTLWFKGKELKAGNDGDYNISYVNQFNACDSSAPYDKRPKVKITATNSSNFTGSFYAEYVIKPVTLDDPEQCTVKISGNRWAFTGSEIRPDVSVTLHRIDGSTYTFVDRVDQNTGVPTEGKDVDYELDYRNSTFVSIGDADDEKRDTGTRVIVREKRDASGTKVAGNCVGQVVKPYIIYGEFQPKTTYASTNSKMTVSGGSINYSPNSTEGGCTVTFYQKKQEYGSFNDDTKENAKEYILKEGGDYTVTVPNIIGLQDAKIDSATHYFEGGASCKILIIGDLAKDTTVKGPGVVSYTPGQEFKLQDKITVVCGGKTLEYGVDYMFDRTPTMNLGTDNEIQIIPFEDKDNGGDPVPYLKNSYPLSYEVKAGLDSITLPNIIGAEAGAYTYAHGEEVIREETVFVEMEGNRLQKDVDYSISIDDKVTVGTHTITIEGKGKYTGTYTFKFKIKPYNLADGLTKKEITVNYDSSVTYTGGTVFPNIKSITAVAPSGTLATLSPGDETKQGDYELIAGGQGDHINWTSGEVKPNFIISGLGNYEGSITLEYSITRKDISEPDVTETPIEDIPYKNGKDITPVPELKYAGRDLAGLLYSDNADDYVNWSDYTKHFTYQYSKDKDLKSVGTKTIRVRGIGNFTGERTISYTVIPLDISLAEVEFVYDTPVYDGQPQQPAFNLWYDGDKILEYTGTQAISSFIREPKVEFVGDHTNATKTALIRISVGENDNYFNTKEITFAILPASLANHTKFMYHPEGENGNVDLKTYKLNYPFSKGNSVMPVYAGEEDAADLKEKQVGIYYDDPSKANHGAFLKDRVDYQISYQYVEPDSEDVEVREEYRNPEPPLSYAGKVKVTITGIEGGNYTDSASFWYYIGKDISSDASISMTPTTTVYNSQSQPPTIKISGVGMDECTIAKYRGEVALENLIKDDKRDFINAGTYYIRIEGNPLNGTYSTKPHTLTYTITPRAFSNSLVIDGFKREYSYTGYDICPVGISVTDYIDNIKYRLTEDVDYTLTYTNNLNAGTAYINIKGQNNFSGSATANFMITSSTISSGGTNGSNSFLDQGSGEISGSMAVSPSNVTLSMDTSDAMYYTGRAVYPKVSIAGMTENIDYTVTYSNNVEVGTAVAAIRGIGNNTGMITKNFRIIAQLSKCTISPIPAQQYTGSPVTPTLTVKCGNTILMEGTDYTVSYANNINIGTATATIRALNNANYTGTATAKFSIGNDVGGFIISGYAPVYTYTGNAITPGVVVETGSKTLVQGTDYTVSYSNNINAGTATITVTGIGKYSGTQTATFVIEAKNIQSCDTTEITDRRYTGDAYTPDVTVSDGGKVLKNGVDYTITYTNNTNPGMATVVIKGTSNNYAGTKVISFKISAVAVKGLKASSVKYNSLKLKWTKQGYADGYQICDANSKVVKTVKKNSASMTGLKPGKTYKYKVRSYVRNADGTKSYGAFSSVLNATTKLRTPTVKVASKAKGQARISWSKVSGASGYEIYYKKSAGAKYKKLKTVNNPNIRVCTVRGMKSGDRAYFRIRAFKNNGSRKVYSALNPLRVITVK